MKITAAICTYNRERYLPQVLGSLLTQTLSSEEFEIIVIDNNSPGNTKEIISNYTNKNSTYSITYFLETKQGLSHARNRSIVESNCDLITFIDDDAYLENNYLEILLEKFNSDSSITAIGGKIILDYETIKPKWENKYLNSLLGYYSPSKISFVYKNLSSNTDYPRGSNMSFRKRIFDEIGNFNVELGRQGNNLIGGEEKDMFQRIFSLKKHTVIYFPELIVYHSVPVERTTKEFIIRQAYDTGRSEMFRTKANGKINYWKQLLSELVKWIASLLLSIKFTIQGQPEKARMLLVFRKYVTKGLFSK